MMLIAATNFAARSACTALGSKPAGRTMGQTDGRTPDRYVDPAPHTLPAFAAAPLPLSIDISCSHGAQQQTRRTLLLRSNDGTGRRTDRRTDGHPIVT